MSNRKAPRPYKSYIYIGQLCKSSDIVYRDNDRTRPHKRKVSYVFNREYALEDVDGGPDGVDGVADRHRVLGNDQCVPGSPPRSLPSALFRQRIRICAIYNRQHQQRFASSTQTSCAQRQNPAAGPLQWRQPAQDSLREYSDVAVCEILNEFKRLSTDDKRLSTLHSCFRTPVAR